MFYNSTTGLVYKHFGAIENSEFPYEHDVFYELNESSDTIYRFESVSLVGDPCGLMGIGYGETIGETYRSEGCFEFESAQSLVGYIKNGDTVGTITPDSLLLTSIESFKPIHHKISVYPNPASEILNISLPDNKQTIMEISTVQGGIVVQRELTQKKETIDVGNLNPGVYLYTIVRDEVILKRGKILVN